MKTPDFYFEAINDPSRLTNPPKSMTNKSAMQQRLAGENTWLVEKRARIFGWGPREIKKYLSSITDEVVRRIVEDNLHDMHNRRTKSKKTLMSRVFGSNNPYKRMSKSKSLGRIRMSKSKSLGGDYYYLDDDKSMISELPAKDFKQLCFLVKYGLFDENLEGNVDEKNWVLYKSLVKEHRGTQVPNELISKNAVERFLKKKTPSNSKSSK